MATLTEQSINDLGISTAVAELHASATVTDLHVDAIIQQRLCGYDVAAAHDTGALRARGAKGWLLTKIQASVIKRGGNHPLFNHADLPRLRAGGADCIAFGLHYWPWQSENGWKEVNKQHDYFDQVIAASSETIAVRTPHEVAAAKQAGKIAVWCGVEGAHCLGKGGARNNTRRLDRLEKLVQRHVGYLTFAHFSKNDAATHCFGRGSNDSDRLSPFGQELVRKANEVKLMIDVSHVNMPGVIDICTTSQKPVMATHSGFRRAYPERSDKYLGRMLSDDALLAIAQTGGVVGIILSPHFLCGEQRAGLSCVVRHLQYGIERLDQAGFKGEDHFAIGSDFDGWLPSYPDEIKDARDLPRITAALVDAGFSDQQVRKIWGDNFLRVWQDNCA